MCKNSWPALEPNLQGDYLDTIVLQYDEVAHRVARHTISPLIAHRLGYEWTAGDWGTPHLTVTLDSHMINTACRHSRQAHSLACSKASESAVRSSRHRSQ